MRSGEARALAQREFGATSVMSEQDAGYVRVIIEQLSRHVLHDHRTGARHDHSVAVALLVALDKAGYQIVRHNDGPVSES